MDIEAEELPIEEQIDNLAFDICQTNKLGGEYFVKVRAAIQAALDRMSIKATAKTQ